MPKGSNDISVKSYINQTYGDETLLKISKEDMPGVYPGLGNIFVQALLKMVTSTFQLELNFILHRSLVCVYIVAFIHQIHNISIKTVSITVSWVFQHTHIMFQQWSHVELRILHTLYTTTGAKIVTISLYSRIHFLYNYILKPKYLRPLLLCARKVSSGLPPSNFG